MADLAARRAELKAMGTSLVFVHMESEERARAFFGGYGVADVWRVSDTTCELYAAFGLGRATPLQVLGPHVVLRGFEAFRAGHRVGPPTSAPMQMPGVFLIRDGRIACAYRYRTVADRPDYLALARCDASVCGAAA